MSRTKRPTKYLKGSAVRSIAELDYAMMMGRWLYFRHKVYHPTVLGNWSINLLRNCVDSRSILLALPNPLHPHNRHGHDQVLHRG